MKEKNHLSVPFVVPDSINLETEKIGTLRLECQFTNYLSMTKYRIFTWFSKFCVFISNQTND